MATYFVPNCWELHTEETLDELLLMHHPIVKREPLSANSMPLPLVRLTPLTTPFIVVSVVLADETTIEVEPELYQSNTKELRPKSYFVTERFRIPRKTNDGGFRSKPSKQGNGSRLSRGGAFG